MSSKRTDALHGPRAWARRGIAALVAVCLLCLSLASTACAPDANLPSTAAVQAGTQARFDPASVPAYKGSPCVVVNGDVPFFTKADLARGPFEEYAPLDSLGRCGVAFALVGTETMPTEKRQSIGEVKPTGWQTPVSKYDFVDGKYLYNRCHLIAFMLAGENANRRNLITGTRTMNTIGMLPLELDVGDYVEDTGNHVLYRVTPCFKGGNLLATGVLMEAQSVEDGGAGIRFCRFCYNAEPGVVIDYATGRNWARDTTASSRASGEASEDQAVSTYVLNVKSRRFHDPDCGAVSAMSAGNRSEFTGTRSQLIEQGYKPCGTCRP